MGTVCLYSAVYSMYCTDYIVSLTPGLVIKQACKQAKLQHIYGKKATRLENLTDDAVALLNVRPFPSIWLNFKSYGALQ